MNHLKVTFYVLVSTLMMVGCGNNAAKEKLDPDKQNACGISQNRVGQKTVIQEKVTFVVEASVPKRMVSAIKDAAQIWNKALGSELLEIKEDSPTTPTSEFKIRFLKKWSDKNKEEQASTNVQSLGTKIVKAEIEFNAKYFRFSTNLRNNTVDMKSLALHELGHALGLSHSLLEDSVMFPKLAYKQDRTELTESDLSALQCGY